MENWKKDKNTELTKNLINAKFNNNNLIWMKYF